MEKYQSHEEKEESNVKNEHSQDLESEDESESSQNNKENSSSKKKYQIIPQDVREKFIQKVISKQVTIKEAAREFGLKFSTSKAILQTFKKEGRIGKKKTRQRKPRQVKKIVMSADPQNPDKVVPQIFYNNDSPKDLQKQSSINTSNTQAINNSNFQFDASLQPSNQQRQQLQLQQQKLYAQQQQQQQQFMQAGQMGLLNQPPSPFLQSLSNTFQGQPYMFHPSHQQQQQQQQQLSLLESQYYNTKLQQQQNQQRNAQIQQQQQLLQSPLLQSNSAPMINAELFNSYILQGGRFSGSDYQLNRQNQGNQQLNYGQNNNDQSKQQPSQYTLNQCAQPQQQINDLMSTQQTTYAFPLNKSAIEVPSQLPSFGILSNQQQQQQQQSQVQQQQQQQQQQSAKSPPLNQQNKLNQQQSNSSVSSQNQKPESENKSSEEKQSSIAENKTQNISLIHNSNETNKHEGCASGTIIPNPQISSNQQQLLSELSEMKIFNSLKPSKQYAHSFPSSSEQQSQSQFQQQASSSTPNMNSTNFPSIPFYASPFLSATPVNYGVSPNLSSITGNLGMISNINAFNLNSSNYNNPNSSNVPQNEPGTIENQNNTQINSQMHGSGMENQNPFFQPKMSDSINFGLFGQAATNFGFPSIDLSQQYPFLFNNTPQAPQQTPASPSPLFPPAIQKNQIF